MNRCVLYSAAALIGAAALTAAAQQVKKTSSEFDSKTYFESRVATAKIHSDDELNTGLRVTRDRQSGVSEWQATLVAVYYGPMRRDYSSASLVGGAVLPGVNHETVVLGCYRGCQMAEQLMVPIPAQVLDRSMAEGLRLRWNAGYGSFEVSIPAASFTTMVDAIRQ